MLPTLNPELLRNLSVYQDVVLAGQTVYPGRRGGAERWEAIEPHLPAAGAILDIGSNFGWFGLAICASRPDCVVASVEADERSAAVQRAVLQSHADRRICLLTQPAGVRMARCFVRAGQRFDAVLCLSVLHWVRRHREMLAILGPITGRFFVEHPDPNEAGAGIERLRRQIGPIGPYLREMFPGRPIRCLGRWPSYRDPALLRELWMVAEPPGWPAGASPGLEVSALARLAPGWPPGSWWRRELEKCQEPSAPGQRMAPGTVSRQVQSRVPDTLAGCRLCFTPQGLLALGRCQEPSSQEQRMIPDSHSSPGQRVPDTFSQLRRRLAAIPEDRAISRRRAWLHAARRVAGTVLRMI